MACTKSDKKECSYVTTFWLSLVLSFPGKIGKESSISTYPFSKFSFLIVLKIMAFTLFLKKCSSIFMSMSTCVYLRARSFIHVDRNLYC